MNDLFDNEIVSSHDTYLALRDDPRHAELRAYCNALWVEFQPYSDQDFAPQFALHTHRRFWEMYLGVALLNLGFNLQPRKSADGPDLHLLLEDRHVWIEATSPGEGVGMDSVPTLEEHSGFVPVPEAKVILRYTNAISEKKGRLDHYIDEGIVGSKDPFVIAINAARIQMSLLDGPMPAILKAVYPIGEHEVIIDKEKMEVTEERYATRRAIFKASGSPISTQSFIDPSYSGISGVLYGRRPIAVPSGEAGEEFLYVHNHVADNPMELEWLGEGKECWIENDHFRFSWI